ncbi:ABC transporter, ATPase, putative [Kipferlia bialata]|uniref:ABC transporter, ATPase, putative n=1 Tax=Kipferlia bialata TaxID=797122 RepID=A0A9K3D012_9EUKA|nr:ABC transporter, ATPase, putative [Kipferlia bialata]|eukprot:g8015.t1
MVVRGSGEYLKVADCVIQMKNYYPVDVTQRAQAVAQHFVDVTQRAQAVAQHFGDTIAVTATAPYPVPRPRLIDPQSVQAQKGYKEVSKARGIRTVTVGTEDIDVSLVDQICHPAQLNAVAAAILRFSRQSNPLSMSSLAASACALVREGGFDALTDKAEGTLCEFRLAELCAALNRLRTLRVAKGAGNTY